MGNMDLMPRNQFVNTLSQSVNDSPIKCNDDWC